MNSLNILYFLWFPSFFLRALNSEDQIHPQYILNSLPSQNYGAGVFEAEFEAEHSGMFCI